jgi:glycosyltransferase involved in cell wall biosynthesis
LKLCFIADGRSIHTQRWCEYFAGRHEVHLVTYDPMERRIDGVVEHVVASGFENLYLSFWPRHLRVARIVKEIGPDLVHAHFIAKYGFHLPFLGIRPTVVSAWGDDVLVLPQRSRLLALFTGYVLRQADLVYAVSRNLKRRIESDFGIAEGKVRYLPFGIDTDLFSPGPAAKSEAPVIPVLCNRGFFPVYDIGTLVRGFCRAHGRDGRLRLVLKGDGPEKDAIAALVRSLGLEEVVSFRARSSFAEVPRDYREAAIYVSTARSDGTPVSLLEAMASGLPCIATNVGGVPEWVSDGVDGVLVPPGDPESLAERLLELASDPQLRGAYGARARARVLKDGDWYKLMPRAEKDYEELVSGRRP